MIRDRVFNLQQSFYYCDKGLGLTNVIHLYLLYYGQSRLALHLCMKRALFFLVWCYNRRRAVLATREMRAWKGVWERRCDVMYSVVLISLSATSALLDALGLQRDGVASLSSVSSSSLLILLSLISSLISTLPLCLPRTRARAFITTTPLSRSDSLSNTHYSHPHSSPPAPRNTPHRTDHSAHPLHPLHPHTLNQPSLPSASHQFTLRRYPWIPL